MLVSDSLPAMLASELSEAIDRRETVYTALGLAADPFPTEPALGRFVPTATQQSMLNDLVHWVDDSDARPIAIVAGSRGVGKTSLLLELNDVVANNDAVVTAVVTDAGSRRSDAQLLRDIITAFGGEPTGRTGLELQGEARARFGTVATSSRRPLLLIDAANFSGSQLEIVRSLLNGSNVRMVLFSDVDLIDRIARRQSLSALAGLTRQIDPLRGEEIAAFIRQRIDAARINPDRQATLIDDAAIEVVASWSAGIPAAIVRLMSEALLEAIARGQTVIDQSIARQVARELTDQARIEARRDDDGSGNPVVQTRIPLPIFEDISPLTGARKRRSGRQREGS